MLQSEVPNQAAEPKKDLDLPEEPESKMTVTVRPLQP